MVPGGSRIKTIDEVDYRRVRVIAIEGTTTDRAAARRLRNTRVNPVDSIEGALEMLRSGQSGWRSRSRRTGSMPSTT
jgi:hypothetical protein